MFNRGVGDRADLDEHQRSQNLRGALKALNPQADTRFHTVSQTRREEQSSRPASMRPADVPKAYFFRET
jgi:hypothetical protein